jgi:hypothetical protein
MASLIVIRIVPQKPTDPQSFSKALAAGGGLQITLAALSYARPENQPPSEIGDAAPYILNPFTEGNPLIEPSAVAAPVRRMPSMKPLWGRLGKMQSLTALE